MLVMFGRSRKVDRFYVCITIGHHWIINQAIQEYIPQKQMKSPKHIHGPWLNQAIKHKMKERND